MRPFARNGGHEQKYYWLAVRGPFVVLAPSFMTPMSRTLMAQASVRIGGTSESTLWSVDIPVPDDRPPETLVGYKTAAARQASFDLLLNAPIDAAREEMRRAERDEVIISP